MHDEQLRQLLERTDASMPPATLEPGLAGRVRRRARRRERVRRGIGSAVVLVIVVAGTWGFMAHGRHMRVIVRQSQTFIPQHVPQQDPIDLQALNVAEAKAAEQAELHLQIANAMLKQQSKAGTNASLASDVLAQTEIAASLMDCRAQAAHLMLNRGDRLLQDDASRSAAVASYERLVMLFPDSPEAVAARERLGRIKA